MNACWGYISYVYIGMLFNGLQLVSACVFAVAVTTTTLPHFVHLVFPSDLNQCELV